MGCIGPEIDLIHDITIESHQWVLTRLRDGPRRRCEISGDLQGKSTTNRVLANLERLGLVERTGPQSCLLEWRLTEAGAAIYDGLFEAGRTVLAMRKAKGPRTVRRRRAVP